MEGGSGVDVLKFGSGHGSGPTASVTQTKISLNIHLLQEYNEVLVLTFPQSIGG